MNIARKRRRSRVLKRKLKIKKKLAIKVRNFFISLKQFFFNFVLTYIKFYSIIVFDDQWVDIFL